MSDPAGRLNIQLERTPQGLRCRIRSTRPVRAAAIFAGRSVAETAALLPMLYSICAKAQSCACVAALESATGLVADPTLWEARQRLVEIETIREHLWRILLDWPRFLGEPPDQASAALLMAQVKALFALLDLDGRLFRPGSQTIGVDRRAVLKGLDALDELISGQVLGRPAQRWLDEVRDADGLARWTEASPTGAARLLAGLSDAGEEALGQSDVAPLPELDPAALSALLLAPDGDAFVATPSWDDRPRETSPFTRQADQGLMRALVARHGNGLLTRLSAQVLEVARLSAGLRVALREPMPPLDPSPPGATGMGLGQVEAARGRLVHLARVAQGRILEYRILAPTEWNFHPEGMLARALAGLPDAGDARLARWAELLILATDPCVAFDLSLTPIAPGPRFVA